MDIKRSLTEIIGRQLGWAEKEIKSKFTDIWMNPRSKSKGGNRLTEEGFKIFTEQMDIKSYKIDFPNQVTFTNQILVWLDHFIDGPYYIEKKNIIVFKEKTAVQLILFSGDIQKFGMAKAMADALPNKK